MNPTIINFPRGARVSMTCNGARFLGTVTDDAHAGHGVIYVAWDGGGVRKESAVNLSPA